MIRQARCRCSQGVTLVELMVAIAVAAIALTLALPSLRDFLMANSITSQVNEVVSTFSLARSEAIKRNDTVFITANSGDWSEGWSIWVDDNSDGNMADDEVIYVGRIVDQEISLSATDGTAEFSILRTGMLGNAATDVIQVCDSRTGETGRAITVTVSGSTRTASFVCA